MHRLGRRALRDEGSGERQIWCKSGVEHRVLPARLNARKGGTPNYIRTAKFTPLTWLPLSLFNQFKRTANVYFLFIAITVLFGTFVINFTPKDWRSKIGPFIFVLSWTALKDLYEDLRRHRDDRKENSQLVTRYNINTAAFEDARWSQVLVGDLLFIRSDQSFPADLVLLQTELNDAAFISTVMLDGETNLKERTVPKVFAEIVQDALTVRRTGDVLQAWLDRLDSDEEALAFARRLTALGAEFQMGPPTAALSAVRGVVTVDKRQPCPLGEANFLPRGCILRNTAFALTLCVYAGDDTKTRLNATVASLKFSNMQKTLNICIRCLLVFVITVSVYATVMSEIIAASDNRQRDWPFYIMFLRFNIAFYHAVPMSLYVVYEMLKLVMGYQVGADPQMTHEGQGACARTADLMEELGQVDFVLSDKTGTLTANEMVFACAHADGQDFGDFRKTDTDGATSEGVVVARGAIEDGGSHGEAVRWFFTCLATCHEVQLESGYGTVAYTGMSPDEVALVEGARDAGVVLERRGRVVGGTGELDVRDVSTGQLTTYEVLAVIQFTSDRKRMTVIIRHGNRAWCITKGADSVMEARLATGIPSAAAADILKFSRAGLRVLVIAARELESDFLEEWFSDYSRARGVLDDTSEAQIAEVVSRLEADLRFVGVTAVEDRLQEGVPQAIDTIKRTGARMWVLTGDKTETAVNIANSCALFGESTKLVHIIDCATVEEARDSLKRASSEIGDSRDAGLVIDGGTLLQAMTDAECRRRICELGMASRSCVCSRMSPMQKLQVVQLVKEADSRRIVLTVGDGANDVPMLLGGNVGIGIRGREGVSAVQVCDVAISQFRFLVPLLLCHGRRSYRRVAIFFCFYLYKNLTLLVADLAWMHWDEFHAHIAFPEYLSIGFNVFFTSWHVLLVLGFDRDIPDAISNLHPELYQDGPQSRLFNPFVFAEWMAYSLLHGLIAWLIPFAILGPSDWFARQFWISSTCAFTNVIHICCLKLVVVSQNPLGKMTLVPTFLAWLMYVCYLLCLCYTPLGWSVQPRMKRIVGDMFSLGAVISMLIAPPIALLPDVVERYIRRLFFPSSLQKLRWKLIDSRVTPNTTTAYP